MTDTMLDPPENAPRFLSIAYHATFLPALLVRHLRPRKATFELPFTNHLPVEFAISVAACAVLIEISLPRALGHRSIAGWT
jgi:hypothetical protein